MGTFIDLTGQKYGRLTVLERAENINGRVAWKCKCDCGNEINVMAKSLRNGNTKSCGCLRQGALLTPEELQNMQPDEIPVGRAVDLRGQTFGKLTVLYRVKPPDYIQSIHSYWKCKCECGEETIVDIYNLRSGGIKTCGKCKKIRQGKQIEPGTRFGRLVVLEESYHKNNRVYWKCKCDCGNIIHALGKSLREGNKQSCGCLHKDRMNEVHAKDITGKRFGKLVAIEPIGSNKQGRILWRCQCDCGNEHITTAKLLLNGGCQSCGCLKSKGESKIQTILTINNINFIKEKSFQNCKSNTGTSLRFDFYVNNKYLIEYDGQQHFYDINYFGGEEQFKKQQQYDKIKNEYCKSHNIPLIRIPYTHYDKITMDDLRPETSQFLIT